MINLDHRIINYQNNGCKNYHLWNNSDIFFTKLLSIPNYIIRA